MSQANPLEVPGTGIVLPMLESLQSQLTATQRLLALLRAQGDQTVSAAVEEQLACAEAHLRKAVDSMSTPVLQPTGEISPTIPWVATSPPEDRKHKGTCLTLRERGDVLYRAIQARKMNSDTVISAEHDPVDSQLH